MTTAPIVIAGEPVDLSDALRRLETYPRRTPQVFDFPGPGAPATITAEEIARTRQVSSRISMVEGKWFVDTAVTAPWTSVDGTLRDADPAEDGGFYDAMSALYNHFASDAPRRVGMAKISKVLHLKRPAQFPILDTRLVGIYRVPAARAAKVYPARGHKRMFWVTVREDLMASADGLAALRAALGAHPRPEVQAFQCIGDLRLLDMLTWRST